MRLLASTLGALLIGSGAAQAAQPVFVQRFTSERPGSATGSKTQIVFPDYNGKPKPVAQETIELPKGTRVDERVVPTCDATSIELVAMGLTACPPDARSAAEQPPWSSKRGPRPRP